MNRLYISEIHKEIEKPQGGGGHGKENLYAAHVCIDGKKALYLTASDFKEPGQFHALIEILKPICGPDISSTTPPKIRK